jgi:hypothetical protein
MRRGRAGANALPKSIMIVVLFSSRQAIARRRAPLRGGIAAAVSLRQIRHQRDAVNGHTPFNNDTNPAALQQIPARHPL